MTYHENHKTDSQIYADVLQELHWKTRVDETEIEVQVDRGVVTLRGDVILTEVAGSHAKKMAAEETTHRVSRVWDVANELQVYGPVFVCFSGQEDAGTRADMVISDDRETAEGGTREGQRILCDGPGCRAESQQVDGWLFVSSGGERRHYCRACLVGYLDQLRGQSGASCNTIKS